MERSHHGILNAVQTAKELERKALPGINLICFSHNSEAISQRGFMTLAHEISKIQKVIYSSFNSISNDVIEEFTSGIGNDLSNIVIEDAWEYYQDNDPWELRVLSFTEETKCIMIDDFHTFMNSEHLSFLDRGLTLSKLHEELKGENISLLFMYSTAQFEDKKDERLPFPRVKDINWCRQLKEISNCIYGGFSNSYYRGFLNDFDNENDGGAYDFSFEELKCPVVL
jgi:hypothetical protein